METNIKYKTKQREMILDYLKKNKAKHLKAEDVLNYFKTQNINIGKSTIYRYLDNLQKENTIRKYIIEEGCSSCYQYADEKCLEHYHLKCSNCGKLIHFDCTYLKNIKKHFEKEHEFELDYSKIVFYGKCKKCLGEIK